MPLRESFAGESIADFLLDIARREFGRVSQSQVYWEPRASPGAPCAKRSERGPNPLQPAPASVQPLGRGRPAGAPTLRDRGSSTAHDPRPPRFLFPARHQDSLHLTHVDEGKACRPSRSGDPAYPTGRQLGFFRSKALDTIPVGRSSGGTVRVRPA